MISFILLVFAGILKACMDILDFHYDISIFSRWKNQQWINPNISWMNKWKNGSYKEGEKFIGSSTFLVWVTDMWHFCEFLMILAICFAIVFYQPVFKWWIDFVICYILYTGSFELFFSKIFKKKMDI